MPQKYENKKQLLAKFEKLRYQKDMFGGSFFSVLLLTFLFFIMPLPESINENILFWRLGMFAFFFVVIVGWYISSTSYYNYCIDILNYQYTQGNFPRKIKGQVTQFTSSQIIFYLVLALVAPFVFISFFEHTVDLETFYYALFGVAIVCIFIFLAKIESFYDRREKLDEVEILTETFIYHDPLNIMHEENGKIVYNKPKEEHPKHRKKKEQ